MRERTRARGGRGELTRTRGREHKVHRRSRGRASAPRSRPAPLVRRTAAAGRPAARRRGQWRARAAAVVVGGACGGRAGRTAGDERRSRWRASAPRIWPTHLVRRTVAVGRPAARRRGRWRARAVAVVVEASGEGRRRWRGEGRWRRARRADEQRGTVGEGGAVTRREHGAGSGLAPERPIWGLRGGWIPRLKLRMCQMSVLYMVFRY